MKLLYSALLGLLLIACNAQNRPVTQQPAKEGQLKIVRTQGLVSGNVGCQLEDKDGILWFGTGGEGVYRYDARQEKPFINFTTADGLCSNHVNAIIQDKAGNILFGTNNGICRYDGKVFSSLTKQEDASKLHICSLMEDREGNLWFGVMSGGVYRYDPSAGVRLSSGLSLRADDKTFDSFLNQHDQVFNLNNHNQLVLDMLQDKQGHIWFSSWNGGGVWQYDPSTSVRQSSRRSLRAGELAFKNFLPSPDYYATNEDRRNPTSFELKTTYQHAGDYISDDMIFSLAEDRAGNLWMGTRNHGACRYDGQFFTSFGEVEGFANTAVYAILEDQQGNIWFTTEDRGVWCYDPSASLTTGGASASLSVRGKAFKNFTTKDGLVNDSVFSILEDKDGNLWFGTRGFGLSRYDGTTFTTFSE